MKRLLLVLALALAALPASAMTTDSATIVALVKATPQLKIDRSVPAMTAFDAKTHPYVRLTQVQHGVGGYVDPEYASIGRMSDGTQVMAVPLESGGSGGVFVQLIFAQSAGGKPAYVGYIDSQGGHQAINITYHGIVAISPKYGANDPNCCPSAYETRTYTISENDLKLVSDKTGTKP